MHEPFICPECGREGRKARGVGVCTRCEADYHLGREDVETWRTDVLIGGEEYAAQEELNRYLRFGDDY